MADRTVIMDDVGGICLVRRDNDFANIGLQSARSADTPGMGSI